MTMESTQAPVKSNIPARYRTLRQKQAPEGLQERAGRAAERRDEKSVQTELARSRSRYRRAAKTTVTVDHTVPLPSSRPAPVGSGTSETRGVGSPSRNHNSDMHGYNDDNPFNQPVSEKFSDGEDRVKPDGYNTPLGNLVPLPRTEEEIKRFHRNSAGFKSPVEYRDVNKRRSSSIHTSSQSSNRSSQGGLGIPADRADLEVERFCRMVLVKVATRNPADVPVLNDTEAWAFRDAIAHKVHKDLTLPKDAILVEEFNALGLERQIRTFELMKDVVFGWQEETLNAIRLVRAPSEPVKDVASVPPTAPDGFESTIYISKTLGKWEKHWVTFHDGVVRYAKGKRKDNYKEKDYTVICHMDSWDFYDVQPYDKDTKKALKAPKSYTFALKSQQPASVFQPGAIFVWYLSTDDRLIYDEWKKYLYDYRSYYLHHIKGLGQPKDTTISTTSTAAVPAVPLVNSATVNDNAREDVIKRSGTVRRKPVTPPSDDEVFNKSGLLGRTYTQRKTEMEARDRLARQKGQIPRPNDPQPARPHRSRDSAEYERTSRPTTSRPTTSHSPTTPQRQPSVNRHKPLLNFDDEPPVPPIPSASRRRAPTLPNDGGPLVQHATSSNPFADPVPSNRPARYGGVQRSASHAVRNEQQFVPGSLLSRTHTTSGAHRHGHGAATQRDAVQSGRPLINLQNQGMFAAGSLLDKIEKQRGNQGPNIYRGKDDSD